MNELADPDVTGEVPPTVEVEEEPSSEPVQATEPEAKPDKDEQTKKTPKGETDEVPEPGEDLAERLKRLEKRAAYQERQLKKLRKERRATPLPEIPRTDRKAPDPKDYDDESEYNEAVIDYRAELKIQEAIGKAREQQITGDRKAAIEELKRDIVSTGLERYPDFKEVALAETVPISEEMLSIIHEGELENPADICYYLAKHTKEATAIQNMSRTQATLALGKVEAKVAKAIKDTPITNTNSKKASAAPPPIKPTPGASTPVVVKDPARMNQAEYEEWRKNGGGK
jgi:hypothetical protein